MKTTTSFLLEWPNGLGPKTQKGTAWKLMNKPEPLARRSPQWINIYRLLKLTTLHMCIKK